MKPEGFQGEPEPMGAVWRRTSRSRRGSWHAPGPGQRARLAVTHFAYFYYTRFFSFSDLNNNASFLTFYYNCIIAKVHFLDRGFVLLSKNVRFLLPLCQKLLLSLTSNLERVKCCFFS